MSLEHMLRDEQEALNFLLREEFEMSIYYDPSDSTEMSEEEAQRFDALMQEDVEHTRNGYGAESDNFFIQHPEVTRYILKHEAEMQECFYVKDGCKGEGKHQCPNCKQWFCDEDREMFLPVDNINWVETNMMCPQCHYEVYELPRFRR